MKDNLRFGALSPPLHEQLDVPPSTVETEQKCADALTLLSIHSVIPPRAVKVGRMRLVKRLEKLLRDTHERKTG